MITVDVEVYENKPDGVLVLDLCKNYTDHRGLLDVLETRMGQGKYRKLLGDQKARAHCGIRETLGGPAFSSVQITLSAELTCNQDEQTIRQAQVLMYEECLPVLDDLLEDAYDGLITRLKRIHGDIPED